jgi:FkbH-like protein
MNQRFKAFSSLFKEGEHKKVLKQIRKDYKVGNLDATEIEKTGRLLKKYVIKGEIETSLEILLLGQFTTTWIKNTLTLVACGNGILANVNEGGFDNVYQDLLEVLAQDQQPDIIVLMPWSDRILQSPNPDKAISTELGFWKSCREQINHKGCSKIVQLGYDSILAGAMGVHSLHDGNIQAIRDINSRLIENLEACTYFLPLSEISAWEGKKSFYCERQFFWTKQPFSEAGLCQLSEHLWAACRALQTGPKKVLVSDLDHTMWGGVVGEEGPLNIRIGDDIEGEAFRTYQKYLKNLAKRGIIICIASKNNLPDALEPFEKNPQMVLQKEDIACFVASWDPKAAMLQQIASTLNLGLDSFVFVDDNPAEREHIRQALPEVTVVELPEDPANYVRSIESGLWFESLPLTTEDRKKSRLYQIAAEAQDFSNTFASLDNYLESLQMTACVENVDKSNLMRVVQMIGKTNQFNLTTRRHSSAQIKKFLKEPRNVCLAMCLKDRFGDHGLISVILGLLDPENENRLILDTWLMSCRVIGRTAEFYLFNSFLDEAKSKGYESLAGEYIPTVKNELVSDLLQKVGFSGNDQIVTLKKNNFCDIKTLVQ